MSIEKVLSNAMTYFVSDFRIALSHRITRLVNEMKAKLVSVASAQYHSTDNRIALAGQVVGRGVALAELAIKKESPLKNGFPPSTSRYIELSTMIIRLGWLLKKHVIKSVG